MNRRWLLAIDDETGVLDMVRSHFELRGFDVFTASDGADGVELCLQILPDVILLDLKMRSADGDTVLPSLRRIVPSAKIFVVSAYQDEITEKKIAGLGVDAYFEKPVSVLRLEAKIREALAIASNSIQI